MDEKWAKSRKSSIFLYKFDKLLLRICAEVLKSHFPLSVLNIYLLNLTKTSFEVPKCPLCTKTPVAALYENVGHRFVLEPLLVVVMDRFTDEVGQESLWTVLLADNIVICIESGEQVEESLQRRRCAVERRGMKVSGIKTEKKCVSEWGKWKGEWWCKE